MNDEAMTIAQERAKFREKHDYKTLTVKDVLCNFEYYTRYENVYGKTVEDVENIRFVYWNGYRRTFIDIGLGDSGNGDWENKTRIAEQCLAEEFLNAVIQKIRYDNDLLMIIVDLEEFGDPNND